MHHLVMGQHQNIILAVGIGHGPGGNAQRNKGVDVPEQKAGQSKGVRRVAAVVKLDHVGDRLLVHGQNENLLEGAEEIQSARFGQIEMEI